MTLCPGIGASPGRIGDLGRIDDLVYAPDFLGEKPSEGLMTQSVLDHIANLNFENHVVAI
jgi:hypothetical protein